MRMAKDDFVKLTIPQKVELLWNEGEIISEKAYYDCNITLFLLDSFYVEVFLNREENEVVSIEIQENAQILYSYATDVSLKELNNLLK